MVVTANGEYEFTWSMTEDLPTFNDTYLSFGDVEFGHWKIIEGLIAFTFDHSKAGIDKSKASLTGRYRLENGMLVAISKGVPINFKKEKP